MPIEDPDAMALFTARISRATLTRVEGQELVIPSLDPVRRPPRDSPQLRWPAAREVTSLHPVCWISFYLWNSPGCLRRGLEFAAASFASLARG